LISILIHGMNQKSPFFDKPEAYLHPRLQAEIADYFIQLHNDGKQVTVETYSELLILRLLRRVREKTLKPDHLAIVNVVRDCGPFHMVVNDDGEFTSPWVGGFFQERAEELF
ncbi:MAG: hypothetical protein NUW00_00820, partial [Candidatus Kaiserbacteria bacterium]|nr:hypothetical protein [Candidatus Kaiserbacteria bacterium]